MSRFAEMKENLRDGWVLREWCVVIKDRATPVVV